MSVALSSQPRVSRTAPRRAVVGYGLGLVVGFAPLACSSGGERPNTENTSHAGGANAGAAPVPLPFAVDDHFMPSGYMGDATSSLEPDDSNCKPRPDGAQGLCHVFRVDEFGSEGWAGLYWLANENDWGQAPGVAIESGAREVSFLAATYLPQRIEFFVGGVDQSGAPYRDSFEERVAVELTDSWTRVTISLEGASYDRVIGGFGFTTQTAPTVLYVDDIRWD